MSSGCLRDYQKGLQPGGTTGLFVQRLGQDPACLFVCLFVFFEMFQLKSLACTLGWGKGGSVALLSNIVQHSFRSNVWCKVASGNLPIFLQDRLLTWCLVYVSLGFSGKAVLCGSLLLGDSEWS